MLKSLYQGFMATVILALFCCGIYPFAVTAVGQMLFRDQAIGGIILGKDAKPIGARLIGQAFSRSEYFHSRPSFAGDKGYDASNSSGSNLGPTHQKLLDAVKGNVESYLKDNPSVKVGEVPVDAVTSSGSGLDPDISPENAMAQSSRVALARHVSAEQVRELIEHNAGGPQWGIFGERAVNVLRLNLALDERYPLTK